MHAHIYTAYTSDQVNSEGWQLCSTASRVIVPAVGAYACPHTHSLAGLRTVVHSTIRSTLPHYHLSCVIVRYLESELNVCHVFADENDDSRAGAQCSVTAGRTTRVVNALVSQELVESENRTMHVYVNESFSKRP